MMHACTLGEAMSVLGFTWPPIEFLDSLTERWNADEEEALEEREALHDMDYLQASLGIGLTPQERVIQERAAKVAAQEAAENAEREQADALAQHAATRCEPASSQEGEVDSPSPAHKRHKPATTSPAKQNIPRSPEALREAVVDEAAVGQMMDLDADVTLLPHVGVQERAAEVEVSKAVIAQAAAENGDIAAARVKAEEVARHKQLTAQVNIGTEGGGDEINLEEPTPTPPVVSSQPAPLQNIPRPQAQPEMSRLELEILYKTSRFKPLYWHHQPDEEGWFLTMEVINTKPIRLDATVQKGTGKGCAHSLGARWSQVFLRWCYTDAEGQIQYCLKDDQTLLDPIILKCPDLVYHGALDQLLSIQTFGKDYLPSKNEMAHTLYSDSKRVKFHPPRNRAPMEWSTTDTKTTTNTSIPVRMWDLTKYCLIGQPLEGPYPKQFKEYCAEKDQELIELQNRLLAQSTSFEYMLENHADLWLPKPLDAVTNWVAMEESTIHEIVARWSAVDIVNDEEEPHLKGKKKGDLSVTKVVYDAVVKALPPKRKLVAAMGSLLTSKAFELPMVPLNITKKAEPKVIVKPPAPSDPVVQPSRETRGRKPAKVTPPAPPPPPATRNRGAGPKPKAQPPQEEPPKSKATKNTAANSRNNCPPLGGQPTRQDEMPEHLKHFNTQQPNASNTTNSTSPQHSHPGSSVSALSSQDSEAITELNQQLKEMSSKLGAEMEMLRKQNDELRMALAKEKCENAEKGARIEEIRNNAAEKDRMYQQWNNMCANMLGTIESIKK